GSLCSTPATLAPPVLVCVSLATLAACAPSSLLLVFGYFCVLLATFKPTNQAHLTPACVCVCACLYSFILKPYSFPLDP
ncbi:hypothetical protein PPACK8108_LOCUS15812, partial [Phakopsora pachyrhizi]